MPPYNIAFIMEQVLGHITHTQNLERNVGRDPEIRAAWGLLRFESSGLPARLPLYGNWTVRAGLQARTALRSISRRMPLDAIFFHTQVPAVLARDWVRRVPSIISMDATPLQYDRLGQFYNHRVGSPPMELMRWRLNRDSLLAARHIVTWSDWAKDGLAEYEVSAEKITTIPPGVNTDDWTRPAPRARREGPVKLLFVGGDLERKGGHVLLEAFAALQPLGAELHLVTRDAPPPQPGVFVHHGLQPNSPELKQLYFDSDIFCLPTYGDCLPMVLSEAGAAGLPAVTTRVAGIPEIVRDGETGLLVPTGDPGALAEVLHRLILSPAERLRLGERAVQHVRTRYDARRNTARLLDALKEQADIARAARKAA
jgi:glycosyltransferase involved in cell wall biosynthesis